MKEALKSSNKEPKGSTKQVKRANPDISIRFNGKWYIITAKGREPAPVTKSPIKIPVV